MGWNVIDATFTAKLRTLLSSSWASMAIQPSAWSSAAKALRSLVASACRLPARRDRNGGIYDIAWVEVGT
jgi:hypothetical protein